MSHLGRAFGAAVMALVAVGCWPVPGGGPSRQAHNPFERGIDVGNVAGFTEQWSVVVGPDVGPARQPLPAGHPIVSEERLVHVATEQSLHGIDPVTGAERWARSVLPDEDRYDEAVIATAGEDGEIALGSRFLAQRRLSRWFDAATGASRTRPSAEGYVDTVRGSTVAITELVEQPDQGDRVLLRLTVAAFDGSGRVERGSLSSSAAAGASWSTPPVTLGTDRVFSAGDGLLTTQPGDATEGPGVRAFPLAGGQSGCGVPGDAHYACPEWATPLDGESVTSPVLSDDEATLYVGTDAGTVHALDAATGALLWSVALQVAPGAPTSPVRHPPALAGGYLYVAADDGLFVVDAGGCGAATCTWSWAAPLLGPGATQPAVAGGVVFVASGSTVQAFDAAGCGERVCLDTLWSRDAGSEITGAPAIAFGRVFVGTRAGRLIAFGP